MVCEMEDDILEEMDIEVLSSMWPEDMNEAGKQFNIEKPKPDQDMLQEVTINKDPRIVDFNRILELNGYSETGSSQLAHLVKNWEYKQANAVRLLREELDNLSKQQQESELKKLEILEEHRFEEEKYGGDKRPISIFDENLKYVYHKVPRRKHDIIFHDDRVKIDAEYDSVIYWKQRAMHLEKLLDTSLQREQILKEKLQDSIENLEKQSSPVEELSQMLKRADNFMHFVLQTAPVVIGHQDKELRYRFIYNHFPSLREEDIIGKTDVEIFTGSGVKESQDFKKEVLERGLPAKREITFETELFGSKTFLIYVEPVFSKTGETIGVNYMGMDITDQVKKREKMAKLREEIAVQKAKETELNKTIHITEETMRAKQMLATMSHEIRSPLSGVVSMTEILSTTRLDNEQRQLVNVMLSSGDLVLQLINDILDLSKVESGVMRLEATKFRPREVVKHVLQTAAASLQKLLTLEGKVADDVPVEVIGDVLRIRQILTNLISNAVKFTHEGKVGIKLYVVPEPHSETKQVPHAMNNSRILDNVKRGGKCLSPTQSFRIGYESDMRKNTEGACESSEDARTPKSNLTSADDEEESQSNPRDNTVWLCCDVYDTGIGIPETALPTLFKKYMQVGADTARKYGGTGLGLAICKQLVELMGGHLTVSSKEHQGSTFTFVLPYKVSLFCDSSDDPDELSDMHGHDAHAAAQEDDINCGFFLFQPRALGSLLTPHNTSRNQKALSSDHGLDTLNKNNRLPKDYCLLSSDNDPGETSSVDVTGETSSESETVECCNHITDKETAAVRDEQSHEDMVCQLSNRCVSPGTSIISNSLVESPGVLAGSDTCQPKTQADQSPGCSSSNNTENMNHPSIPKILLVEDSKINVMVTQSMMKQLGHKIDVVHNGVEAVRAVQHNNYDLILMDVCMPVMDGLQATRLIRSFEESGNWDAAQKAGIKLQLADSDSLQNRQKNKRISIIAMTANALSESAEECYANGMDSFVSKPVTFQTLKQCLQDYLH